MLMEGMSGSRYADLMAGGTTDDERSPLNQKGVEQLKALAHETRLRIIVRLARRAGSVSDLCDDLELNQSLVSWHLGILRKAGLVVPHQQRLFTVYEFRESEFDRLVRMLRNSVP